jgi:DNA-binding transcriptional LysR family regulator
MRVFVAILEEGSLSGAARRLRLSQPAVSQVAAGLEREFGAPLLIRGSTGVRATPIGTVLADEARAVLARYEQAVATVSRDREPEDGLLRVGLPLEVRMELLADPLAELAAASPRTRVELRHLSTAAQLEALRAGELELGLLRERADGDDLDALPVGAEPLGVLLTSPAAAEIAVDGEVRLDRLAGLEWLSFPRADSPAWFDEITAVLRSHGLRPRSALGSSQSLIPELKLASVLAGGVFALAPARWPTLLPDGVEWCALTGRPLVRRTWATWPSDSRRRDLARLVAALDDAALSASDGRHN